MKLLKLALPVAMIALVLAACGDSGETATTVTPATTPATAAATTPATTPATAAPTSTMAATTTVPMATTQPMTDGGRTIEIIMLDEAFNIREIEIEAGEVVTLIANNKDTSGEPHNLHVRTDTDDWFTTIEEAPDVQELTIQINEPGEYSFFCDTHPQTMEGVIIVGDGM